MDKKRVIGYIRVGKDSSQIDPIGMQRKAITKAAIERYDSELIDIYEDMGVCGKADKRIGFHKMVVDAEAHKFDCVVVKNIARISRDVCDAMRTIRRLTELGIEVYFIAEDLSTKDTKFKTLFTLLCALADEEQTALARKKGSEWLRL